ncbi:hypothetical protein FFLO_04166 [Filobasidium floriforme]|uniref:Uncharacterized protein n=2 Tax=Filobasidium floriforme TaxID=5210 RepID=A0A8K0NSI4_9TREE|nr:hypothetical protein FFLO_04166 [Filobasidium floriforme]
MTGVSTESTAAAKSSLPSAPQLGQTSTRRSRGEYRMNQRRNKGEKSAAHCNLKGFAMWNMRPSTEEGVIETRLKELKKHDVRRQINGNHLFSYQEWAAKQAGIKDEKVKLCLHCFRTYGLLKPQRDRKTDPNTNACLCERVTRSTIEENLKKDKPLEIGSRYWFPPDSPKDLD